jgi:hypothetical protein
MTLCIIGGYIDRDSMRLKGARSAPWSATCRANYMQCRTLQDPAARASGEAKQAFKI